MVRIDETPHWNSGAGSRMPLLFVEERKLTTLKRLHSIFSTVLL